MTMQWKQALSFVSDHKLLAVYVLTAALSLFWVTPLFLLIILAYPGVFLLRIAKDNFLIVIPILALFNASIFIVSATLLDLANLPVSVLWLTLFNIALVLAAHLALNKRLFSPVRIKVKNQKFAYIAYGIFLLAIATRVLSVVGVEVPITHDPISHAFGAKRIATTQAIDYFYPAGLHVLIAFIGESLHINFALATLYVTNFLNAFSVLTWSIVAFAVTKNRIFSILVAVLMFIAPYPAILYYVAGKNAFIASVAFMPLVFYGLYKFIKNVTWRNSALLVISLLGLFFVYYPSFGFMALFTAVIMLLAGIHKIAKKDKLKPYIYRSLAIAAIVLLMGIGWIATNWDSYLARGSEKVEIENRESTSSSQISQPEATELMPAAKSTLKQFEASSNRFSTYIFPLTFLALITILLVYRKKVYLTIPAFALAILGTNYMFNLLEMTSVHIIKTAGDFLFFQIFALSVAAAGAWVLQNARLDKKRWLLVCIIILAVLLPIANQQYKNYSQKSENHSYVDEGDIETFVWINANIDNDAGFISDARRHPRRETLIFPVGAGSWLPVYTGNDIATPFHEGGHSKQTTHDNYALYSRIEKQPDIALCNLHANGFTYYYHDLNSWESPQFDITEVASPQALYLVYKNSSAEIYRINSDSNQCDIQNQLGVNIVKLEYI